MEFVFVQHKNFLITLLRLLGAGCWVLVFHLLPSQWYVQPYIANFACIKTNSSPFSPIKHLSVVLIYFFFACICFLFICRVSFLDITAVGAVASSFNHFVVYYYYYCLGECCIYMYTYTYIYSIL